MIAVLRCLTVFLVVACAGAGEDPAAWRFTIDVDLAAAAPAIDLQLVHDGLAQADARDLRVCGPDGAPVSLFVAFADATSARVVIDATAGPGRYVVRLGNLARDLPALVNGMALAGRADFAPAGGFTAISYDPVQPVDNASLKTAELTVAQFTRWREQAAALEAGEAAKQPDPKLRRWFALPVRMPTTSTNLAVNGVQGHWLHHVRALIRIEVAGDYPFVVANGNESQNLGVLLVDGDVTRPAIPGWYLPGSVFGFVVGTVGSATLGVGDHVLDFYTNRQNPELRMGRLGSDAPADYLDGRVAAFPGATRLASAAPRAIGDEVAAWLASVEAHLVQGAHTTARRLSRLAGERFPARGGEFAALAERADVAAYDADWLTEGKYVTRVAAVADRAFMPPLAMVADVRPQGAQPWDPAHASTDRWVEGRSVYGLPFDIQPKPYGVTSGTAVWDNVLYVGTREGGFHAVDVGTGRRRWTFASPGSARGAPLVYRGLVYFGALDRRLYALDLASGRMAWNHPARDWIESTPCAADGRIFVGSRDGRLYALDARLGVERWQADLGSPLIATPLTDGRRVYVGTHGGAFVALDAVTGAIVWRHDVGAAIDGGACLADGLIAFGDAAGKVHGLRVDDGSPAWPAVAIAGAIVAAPIRIGDGIWGGTLDGKGFAVDARDGRVGWRADLTGAVWRAPVYGQGTLVFTTRGGSMHFRPTAVSGGADALQVAAAPVIDGRSDDAAWAKAPVSRLAYRENGLAVDGEGGGVRVLWDAQQLYLALDMAQAPTAGEAVTIAIDPRGDGAAIMRFTIGADGVRTQALVAATPPASWAPEWTAAVALRDGGWSAEVAIPFASLPPEISGVPGNDQRWRANVVIARGPGASPSSWGWSPVSDAAGIGAPTRWAAIHFLTQPAP